MKFFQDFMKISWKFRRILKITSNSPKNYVKFSLKFEWNYSSENYLKFPLKYHLPVMACQWKRLEENPYCTQLPRDVVFLFLVHF